jgi:hypothetical protein
MSAPQARNIFKGLALFFRAFSRIHWRRENSGGKPSARVKIELKRKKIQVK